MALAPTKLYRGTPAQGAAVTVYTVPATGVVAVEVLAIILTNTAASAAVATISLGGVAIGTGFSVPANDVRVLDAKLLDVLAPGEVVAIGQTTTNALTARVMGLVQT